MSFIEKHDDLSSEDVEVFLESRYVCIDTETTGLNYLVDRLCTIQLFCETRCVLIRFDESIEYSNLKQVLVSEDILKVFHNAVFDVSFLMKNLQLNVFGELVCTKIASKIVNGIDHSNSLKSLLKEYLNIEINKDAQLSDWSKDRLSSAQKEYAINDVRYLYLLWSKLYEQLKRKELDQVAFDCFRFVASYKKLTDRGIENIFAY